MDPAFKEWFLETVPMNRVVLVTGSDHTKTIEQLGRDFFDMVPLSLQCCGNDIYKLGKHRWGSHWTPSEDLIQVLEEELDNSEYWQRYGNHIETRVGMVNFSIVGRGAVGEERDHYAAYDKKTGDREAIAARIREKTGLEAVCGGETGIDIFPKGNDKSQLLYHLYRNISFFGDACHEGGNDYAAAQALMNQSERDHEVYHVTGPEDTKSKLQTLLENLAKNYNQ